VPWTFDEIQSEWFDGPSLQWDSEDVEASFDLATKMRGLRWVTGANRPAGAFPAVPGLGRRGGYGEFLRVYWFGKRMASIIGAPGADDLIARVIGNDPDADEEATAIYLLRSRNPGTELQIAPGVKVGSRDRRPDFKICYAQDPWTFVELQGFIAPQPAFAFKSFSSDWLIR